MHHWLSRAAALHPERVAVQTPSVRLSYRELELRAARAAGALGGQGVRPGGRVALGLGADEEFAVVLHGCMLSGAVAVPIDLRLPEPERTARAAGAIYVDRVLDGAVSMEPAPLRLDAVTTLMHTSGTSGAPRAVALSYGNWLANALGSAVALGLDAHERWLCPLPLAHVGGLSVLIRSAIYGTTAIVHRRFDAEKVKGALMDPAERVTLVSLVPTMLVRLLDAGLRQPPALRCALVGGGPIAPALITRAAEAGVQVAPTYGMTEACSQIATYGWPLPEIEIRIADDGEVLLRGPQVARGALAADGWLHTGDLGTLDERGRLTITGRKSEMIITGGENVAPSEVEEVLLEHPAVADAGVFSRPDREWGEAVVAVVVVRDRAVVTTEELRAHCAVRLASFKVPKQISITERLPRGETGKLLRHALG